MAMDFSFVLLSCLARISNCRPAVSIRPLATGRAPARCPRKCGKQALLVFLGVVDGEVV